MNVGGERKFTDDLLHRIRHRPSLAPVHIVGSTPYPDEGFMQQVVRTLTGADDGRLAQHRVLICDRDTKWSAPVRARLRDAGHYHHERNHQGIENALIASAPATGHVGRIRRRPRLGGLLNYYRRAARESVRPSNGTIRDQRRVSGTPEGVAIHEHTP
jgi:hypothetical protein